MFREQHIDNYDQNAALWQTSQSTQMSLTTTTQIDVVKANQLITIWCRANCSDRRSVALEPGDIHTTETAHNSQFITLGIKGKFS